MEHSSINLRQTLQLTAAVAVVSLMSGAHAQDGTERPDAPRATPGQAQGEQDRQPDAQGQQSAGGQQTQTSAGGQRQIEQLSSEHENLSTFAEALQATGLADALAQGTGYTVFAPTDEAFEASDQISGDLTAEQNREQLTRILRAHIVADDVDPDMASRIGQAMTVDGGTVSLQGQGQELTVGGASIVESGIQLGNLRVYAIDQVLEANPEQAAAAAGFQASGTGANGASAQGQGAGQQAGGQPPFEEVDRDNDGELSRVETAMIEGADFTAMDSNQDGSVSRSEYMEAGN